MQFLTRETEITWILNHLKRMFKYYQLSPGKLLPNDRRELYLDLKRSRVWEGWMRGVQTTGGGGCTAVGLGHANFGIRNSHSQHGTVFSKQFWWIARLKTSWRKILLSNLVPPVFICLSSFRGRKVKWSDQNMSSENLHITKSRCLT